MRINWKGPIEDRRVKLLKEGKSYGQIAQILSKEFGIPVTYDAVTQRCKTSGITRRTINVNTTVNVNINNTPTPVTTNNLNIIENMPVDLSNLSDLDISNNCNLFPDGDDDYINSKISLTPEKAKLLKDLHQRLTDLKPRKVLSLSDLHSPFINFKACNKALLDNQDADILVLNGDVYDGYAMSHFDKIKDVNFDVELAKVEKFLEVVTKMFKLVVWVGGNHDLYRFEKFVAKNCGGMKDFIMKNANPMEYLAKKFNNVIVVPHNWVEIGDVIFSHPEDFANAELKTVVDTDVRLRSIRQFIPNPDYRAVVIGHTHQLGKVVKNGILLAEQGCMCHLYDYKFQRPAKNSWVTGYAVVEYDENMKVIFNKTNMITID
jgi:Icc-related predicted phosphoesterase